MTISKELFLAILSMDSYNRGYGAGISNGEHIENGVDLGLGDTIGSKVGSATVSSRVSSDANGAAQTAGFYAIAYTLTEDAKSGVEGIAPGTTIISYRGTDSFLNSDVSGGSAPLNGWGVTPDNPPPANHGARVCRKTSCAGV